MSGLKETKEIAIAVGKLAASTITSLKDGKFELLTDTANYFDDIPAVFAAIGDAGLVKDELKNLTQAGRAEVKAAVVDQIIRDLGAPIEDQELLFAIADIAEAALAVAYIVSINAKPEVAE
jgi:hypothetical protein